MTGPFRPVLGASAGRPVNLWSRTWRPRNGLGSIFAITQALSVLASWMIKPWQLGSRECSSGGAEDVGCINMGMININICWGFTSLLLIMIYNDGFCPHYCLLNVASQN